MTPEDLDRISEYFYPLIRTDFSEDGAWELVQDAINPEIRLVEDAGDSDLGAPTSSMPDRAPEAVAAGAEAFTKTVADVPEGEELSIVHSGNTSSVEIHVTDHPLQPGDTVGDTTHHYSAVMWSVGSEETRSADFPVEFDGSTAEDDYRAHLTPVDDPAFTGVSAHELSATAADRIAQGAEVVDYVVLADTRSMQEARAGVPVTVQWVCVVGEYLDDEDPEDWASPAGSSFRTEPRETGSVEANLTVSNLSFAELGSMADPDGVLRDSTHS